MPEVQLPEAGVDLTWFQGLPPLRISREALEDYRNPVQKLIDRMSRDALDQLTAEEYRLIYGAGTMTTEEVAKSLGLDKVTVPSPVEPWVSPSVWTELETRVDPPPSPPAPEVADRWDPVGPETRVLDFTDTYMSPVHRPEELLELAVTELEGVEYDTLVGTGLSGTIAVTDLARKLNKRYLIVRKANDGTHSSLPVEGQLGKRWVFVDDLISTGATWARVYDTVLDIKNNRGFDTEYVGALLYTHDRWAPGFYDREQGGHAGWYLLSKYHPDNQKAEPEISW